MLASDAKHLGELVFRLVMSQYAGNGDSLLAVFIYRYLWYINCQVGPFDVLMKDGFKTIQALCGC